MRGWTLSALALALLGSACGSEGASTSEQAIVVDTERSGVTLATLRDLQARPVADLNGPWIDFRLSPPPPRELAWKTALVSQSSVPGDLELRGLAGIRDRVALVGKSAAEVLIDGEPVLADRGEGSSFIIALDRNGELAWARRSTIDYRRVRSSAGGELLVAGADAEGELVVQRWGADGNLLREQRWACRAEIAGLAPTPDNGYVLAANLTRSCGPAGATLDDGAVLVGFDRKGPGLLEFWKGLTVIDLDALPDGDLMVARADRSGAHALVRIDGVDGRVRWSASIAPRRAARVTVDPFGRTFLATDEDLTAWTVRGKKKWRSSASRVASLTAGRGWVARSEAGSSPELFTLADGVEGGLLLRWTGSSLSAGHVSATAQGDAIVSVDSLHEVGWDDDHPVALGAPGHPRVTILRLQPPGSRQIGP